jgi:trimeric autotransporter adhesin
LPGLGAPGVGGGQSFQLGGVPAVPSGTVSSSLLWDPDGQGPLPPRLVIGGSFSYCGAVLANNLAVVDLATGDVTTLGGGVDGVVWALAVLPNGDLVAAGSFQSAGGSSANRIARWNGTAWASLGSGCNDIVRALAVLPTGDLVAGGDFTQAGGGAALRTARWNGATWAPLGAGMASGWVWALVTMPNGDLIAGGMFGQAGGVAAQNIARWNGTAWSALGTGYPGVAAAPGLVYALAVRANGQLVCGGQYGTGQFVQGRAMQWNGAQWSPVGTDIAAVIWSLREQPNGNLVAGTGLAGGCGHVFDGVSWSLLGGGLPRSIRTITVLPGGDLAVGGDFVSTPSEAAHHLARWNGAAWSPLVPGSYGSVAALAVLPNAEVVAGGWFSSIGGVSALGLARRSGTSWAALNLGVNGVSALRVGGNGELFVAGFTGSGTGLGDAVVAWDGTVTTPLGTSSNGTVHALAQLQNGTIVAAGTFTTINGVNADRIAAWTGAGWASLRGGMNDDVYCLAVLDNGDLVAGGRFTAAGGAPASRIARWNGLGWQPVGSGTNGEVHALLSSSPGHLIAGGGFSAAGGTAAPGVARWDGTGWTGLGAGLGSTQSFFRVATLAELPNGDLVAGGQFSIGGAAPFATLARWNGISWAQLAGGVEASIAASAALPNGDLVVGGVFAAIGSTVSSMVAQLTTTCAATALSYGTGCAGGGGLDTLTASTLPWLGSTYRAMSLGSPANSLVLGVRGLAPVAVPMASILPQGVPGCSLWVSPDLLDLYLPVGGQVAITFGIPNAAALIGQVLRQQVTTIELSAGGGIVALTSSNALALTIGSF